MRNKIIYMFILGLSSGAVFSGDLIQCPEAKDWVAGSAIDYTKYPEGTVLWNLSPTKVAEGWHSKGISLPLDIKLESKTNWNFVSIKWDHPYCELYLSNGMQVKSHNKEVINYKTLKNFTRDETTFYYNCRGNNCAWEWTDYVQCPEAKDWMATDTTYESWPLGLTLKRVWILTAEKRAEGWKGSATFPADTTSLTEKNTITRIEGDEGVFCTLKLIDGTEVSAQNNKRVNYNSLNPAFFDNIWGNHPDCKRKTGDDVNKCKWAWWEENSQDQEISKGAILIY